MHDWRQGIELKATFEKTAILPDGKCEQPDWDFNRFYAECYERSNATIDTAMNLGLSKASLNLYGLSLVKHKYSIQFIKR